MRGIPRWFLCQIFIKMICFFSEIAGLLGRWKIIGIVLLGYKVIEQKKLNGSAAFILSGACIIRMTGGEIILKTNHRHWSQYLYFT